MPRIFVPCLRGIALALVLFLAACSGSSSNSNPGTLGGCLVLGAPSPASDNLGPSQVLVEVKLIQAETNFLDQIGIDLEAFDIPKPDSFPSFGGDLQIPNDLVLSSQFTGGPEGTYAFLPKNQHNGAFVGRASRGGVPGVGQTTAFVQLPGTDRQCVEVYEALRQPIGNLSGNPITRPLVPSGDLGSGGLGIGWGVMDDPEIQIILRAVNSSSQRQIIAAPKVTVLNNQRAVIVHQQFAADPAHLNDNGRAAVQNYGGNVTGIYGGVTLDVKPTVSADRRFITLEIRPTSSALVAVTDFKGQVNGQDFTIQLPVVQSVAIQSTVTVSDGGTILIGGLKDVPPGKDPKDVPLLDKIPYVNRLFRNVGTGTNAESLMIMVKAQIIAQ